MAKEHVNMPSHTYRVGNITFIVTPVYSPEQGETMLSILLKLMKAEIERG